MAGSGRPYRPAGHVPYREVGQPPAGVRCLGLMRRLVIATAMLLPVLGACTRAPAADPPRSDPPTGLTVNAAAPYRLASFTSCAPLLRALKDAAKDSVGPFGFPFGYGNRVAIPAAGGPVEDRAAPSAGAPKAGTDYSGTNVQEAGVDEPDVVKTDGTRIVVVSGGQLRVVDAATRRVTGTLRLAAGGIATQLLLAGDRALVFGLATVIQPVPGGPASSKVAPYAPAERTTMTLVDLAGGRPAELSTLTFDGRFLDARQVGDTVRVVLSSRPTIRFPFQTGQRTERQRVQANQKAIEAAGIDAWLPTYTLKSGGTTTSGRLDCGAVSTTADFAGVTLLNLLTFDLTGPLGTGDAVSVAADGDTVYATADSLYVSNDRRWDFAYDDQQTKITPRNQSELYQFDISGTARPRFLASGRVPGHLMNSYSMSEFDGKLRVATTTNPAGSGGPQARATSTSTVSVLTRRGGTLAVTGSVGGLGRSEQIYAVRFAGPVAYVVTFRQTDPLYVIDLRDQDRPKVAGELKVPGYSSYLHPLGADRLIGVGMQADGNGRTTGLQVSVFSVADPAAPARTAHLTIDGTWTSLGSDAHGFLYWPATGTLVIPYAGYSAGSSGTGGALVLKVGDGSISRVGTISSGDSDRWNGALRSLVVGGTLWTVTYEHLTASDLGTLRTQARLPLG
jgi:hypothetical protein